MPAAATHAATRHKAPALHLNRNLPDTTFQCPANPYNISALCTLFHNDFLGRTVRHLDDINALFSRCNLTSVNAVTCNFNGFFA